MKKIISVIAVLCLLCSFAASAFANDVTNTFTKDIPVNVNIDAGTFSVSVPLDTISLDSTTNGKTQSSTIKNNGNLPVVIKDISIIKNENNGWSQIDNNVPFTDYKQFKIEVSGESTPIAANSTGSYQYTVSVPPIQPTRVNETIATIKVTVAVDDTFYTPVEPSLPQAVTPTLVKFNDDYYKIAEYGPYSLLLLNNTVEQYPNTIPEGAVYVNLSKDYSIPSSEGTVSYFDLTNTEIKAFYSGVTAPNNAFLLRIGSDNTTYHVDASNKVQNGTAPSTYHRPAVWVKTSSLPSLDT